MIDTNNHAQETEENLRKVLHLEQKNVNLVIKYLVREVSDNRSVEMGKEKDDGRGGGGGGCGFY